MRGELIPSSFHWVLVFVFVLVNVYAKIMALYHHVCIVFLPNPVIEILEIRYGSSRGWLTLLQLCYWLAWKEYKTYLTMKYLISA